MPKDLTARSRIAAYLSTNGPIEDEQGRATAVLKDAVGYTGTSLGFVQLISSMEKSGLLLREVRGKRTYRISPTEELAGAAAHGSGVPGASRAQESLNATLAPVAEAAARVRRDDGEIDYDELAATVLTQAARALATRNDPAQPTASVRRRLDQLAVRNAELEREVARARAERDAVAAERDELRTQLEAASHNLSLLTERLGTPRKPQSRVAERLDSEERALLYRLSERSDRRHEAVS